MRSGLIEIKCRSTDTNIDTLIAKIVPEKNVTPIMWQMAHTGRRWCDFLSFDPPPRPLTAFIRRIERDDEMIQVLDQEVVFLLAEAVTYAPS
jgi:hypothetical protein